MVAGSPCCGVGANPVAVAHFVLILVELDLVIRFWV